MKQSTFYINAWYSRLYRFIYGPDVKLTDITNKEIFVFKLLIGTLLYIPLLVTFNFMTSIYAVYVNKYIIKYKAEYDQIKSKFEADGELSGKELDDYFTYTDLKDNYKFLRYNYLFLTLINFCIYAALLISASIFYDLYIIINGAINNYHGLTYLLEFNSPVLYIDDFGKIGIFFVILVFIIGISLSIVALINYILNKSDNKSINFEIKPKNNIKWDIKS